jgi:hypothetical protein
LNVHVVVREAGNLQGAEGHIQIATDFTGQLGVGTAGKNPQFVIHLVLPGFLLILGAHQPPV